MNRLQNVKHAQNEESAPSGFINHGGDRCISFGGMRIDREVGTEVIERLQPLGIEAAFAAQAVRSRASEDKRRQVLFGVQI